MMSRCGRKYLRFQRLAGGLLNSVKIRSSVPPVPMIGWRTAEWSHEGVFVTTLSPFPETSSQTFERRIWGVCAETRPWPTLFSKPLSPKIGRRTVAKVVVVKMCPWPTFRRRCGQRLAGKLLCGVKIRLPTLPFPIIGCRNAD